MRVTQKEINKEKLVRREEKARRSGRNEEGIPKRIEKNEEEVIGKLDKTAEMTVSWWNGGGKISSRIMVNPVLQQFLTTKPDIFAYGEAQAVRVTKEMSIAGYKTIIRKAKMKGQRRGMVIYYKNKLANIITKQSSSKKFDIL